MSDIHLNEIYVILGQFQNSTLDEQVELLEGQVVVLQDEVSEIETDVDFLFDEQAIQDERLLNHDERLFSLEQISIDVDTQLDVIDDTLEGNRRPASQRIRITHRIYIPKLNLS